MKILEGTDRNQFYVLSTAVSDRETLLWKINENKLHHARILMSFPGTLVHGSIQGKRLMIAAVVRVNGGSVVQVFNVNDIK